jgi:glycosyltransferase involved in cell wall biosynthesis
MKTTLFIPVLNEIVGLKLIMPRVKKEWVDEILFVDGGSTDGSYEYLEQQGYKVIQQKGRGLELAYWACFDAAAGDVIITFSPDNNSIPELIPLMIQKMREGYDLVIASRYLNNAKSDDDDAVTAFGNWLFTKVANILHGGQYTDFIVMYRAFRKDLITQLDLERRETGEFPVLQQQLMIRAVKHRLKIAEIPGDEPKRIGGVRKVRIFYHGWAVLYVIIKELFVHRVR